jgi:hypothetical protein
MKKPEQLIEIKIFMGYLQNGEIQMHLNQSPSWKEANLFQTGNLKEVHYNHKEYIGHFIPSNLAFDQLKQKERELKAALLHDCPNLNLDKYPIYLFPQLFLY